MDTYRIWGRDPIVERGTADGPVSVVAGSKSARDVGIRCKAAGDVFNVLYRFHAEAQGSRTMALRLPLIACASASAALVSG
jgi:hypothetical protein